MSRFNKIKLLPAIALVGVLLTSCNSSTEPKAMPTVSFSSSPASEQGFAITGIDYRMLILPEIEKQLRSESLKQSQDGFTREVFAAGAKSVSKIYYTTVDGSKEIDLFTVFIFPASAYDATIQPDQPNLYGDEVLRENGIVFAVAGPQDMMFPIGTQDADNVTYLYERMYKPQFWIK